MGGRFVGCGAEVYGGAGLGYFEYVAAIEELASVCGAVGLSMAAHNSLCTNHILTFGAEEQKQRWLPRLASGEHIGAWGLTEAGTGSDAMRMRCTAVREGDEWVLNGTKNWITHGITAEVAVVLVRTGELLDSHGITALVVERGTPGFRGGKKEQLGMRASGTAELVFEDCRVPAANGGAESEGSSSDEDSRRRPDRHRGLSLGIAGGLRRGGTMPNARAVRSVHCPFSGHRIQVGGHGRRNRAA